MWFLFKILLVRGRNTCLCKGELCFILLRGVLASPCCFRSFFWLLVHWSYDHFYIHCYYLWYICVCVCVSSSPIFICVVSSLSLYACFFTYAILISVSHMMPWWVLFKCFKKTSCESLSCRELSSCKVFQEFVVGIDLLCNTTSVYEFSDLRLLSWFICFVVVLSQIAKGGDC